MKTLTIHFLIFIGIYSASCMIDAAQAAVAHEGKSQEEAYQKISQKLSAERIENIVIINDQSEYFANFFDFSLMTEKLTYALIDQQTILCSKAVFKNIQKNVVFLKDLFDLDITSLKEKYSNFLARLNDQQLLNLSTSIKRIYTVMGQLDFNNVDQRLKDELFATLAMIPDLQSYLFAIFFINQVYQDMFSQEIYFVFNINEHYILLITQKKINELFKDLSMEDVKSFQASQIENFYSIYLGMYLNNKDRVSDIDHDVNIKHYIVDPSVDLGPSLQDALRKIFVNKYEFSKEQKSSYLLPRFNIFMNGHGSKEDVFVGITDQYFEKILIDFNNRVKVKNLLVSSCYPGGNRFLKEEKAFRKLNYTMIFEGSLATVIYFTGFSVDWLNFFKNFDRNFFTNVFKILSEVSVDYQRLFKEFETNVKSFSDIANYISIKFPNTEWITASDYSTEVLNLTKTKMFVLGDKTVHIPREKETILLNTNVILGTLFFDFPIKLDDESMNPRAYSFDQSEDSSIDKKVHFKILPIYYKNNNYFISKMKFKIVERLDRFYSSTERNSFESTSSTSTDLDRKDILDQYIISLLEKIFYFSDVSSNISIESPIFILIDQLIIQDVDNKEAICFKVLMDIQNKVISFDYPVDETAYDWELSSYDRIKNELLSSYQSEERKDFLSKLENLPKSLEQAPETVQRSHKAFAQQQAILQKKLNPKAKEFVPPLPKKEPVAKKPVKKVIHNPYAKVTSHQQVFLDDKKDQKPILSTFDPRANPYAKAALEQN